MRWFWPLVCLSCLGCLHSARASEPVRASPFDPSRHMRVAEVKPGMKGYGLSVFSGTKIDRFEVEVVSILRNFNPQHDVLLIRCSGANLEHSGAVGGMSGSPIYLTDEQGRERLVGAFAYGWPLLKDPLAGVQPIEYMLEVPDAAAKPVASTQPAISVQSDARHRSTGPVRWSLGNVVPLPGRSVPRRFPVDGLTSLDPNPGFFNLSADRSRLQPLATPMMAGGVPTGVLDSFGPLLRAYGLVPLQAGGGASPQPDANQSATRLEPGATLAVPLVSGDLDLTLIGTVTEVLGDRVYGFGHPFQSEGSIALPMGSGHINAVLSRLDQSQKLGAMGRLQGTLTSDHSVGVAGTVGPVPPTTPVELRVVYADGSQDQTYRYECANHRRLTPILSGIAVSAALAGHREPPEFHTLKYDLKMEFTNGQTVDVSDVAVNLGRGWPMQAVVAPLIAATDNPFESVALSKLTGTVTVLPEARQADILSVQMPRMKYKPDETIKAFVTYRPFRAPEATMPIELKLPHDLADGSYQLVVSGWDRFLTDEQMARPFRFTAENSDEVFAVLRDVVSLRHDALYVRLLRQPDGVAVGRVAMPRLPSSRRQILLGSGRSNTTPFVSSTVKVVPTDLVLNGSADFAIEIDSQERIETSAGRAAKPEAQPTASPADGRQKPARTEPAREDAKPDHDKKGQPEAPSGDD